MTQTSGPISSGTLAERQFSDVLWRDLFGDEPGVVGDLDGSAYALTLPTNSDTAQVGSTSQDSKAVVAGFSHKIPAGTTEGINIPAAVGSDRTDLIVLRYDPANTGAPGPVRLTRIAGTSAGLPAYDASPPGVEDLPLWAVTRRPGQSLSQATTKRAFTRLSRLIDVPPNIALPPSAPLGTRAEYGNQEFRRELGAASTPVWRELGKGSTGSLTPASGWASYGSGNYEPGWHKSTQGVVTLRGMLRRTGTDFLLETSTVVATMPADIRPSLAVPQGCSIGLAGGRLPAYMHIASTGAMAIEPYAGLSGTMKQNTGFVSLNGISWFL